MTNEEAIKKLEHYRYCLKFQYGWYGKDDDEAIDMAIKALEKTRWILVSERLPEIQNYSDNYLVTLKRGGVHIAMFTECDGKHWWTYDDVEAWMPLPEPYKEREEEE